jgi:hypothetical protein
MYLAYWTTKGSLRLYSSRNAATYASGHGRSPHFPAVGSPGSEKTSQ